MRRRANRAKGFSEAAFIVSGPDSALDSSVPSQALAKAKEDCAYHRAQFCEIQYTERVITTELPDLRTVGKFSCLRSCGRIVESAANQTADFLEEEFEGQPAHVFVHRIVG